MSFDRITKVLSGVEVPPFYSPNLTVGEFLLLYLRRDPFRVIQTNHDDDSKLTAGGVAKLGCQIASSILKHVKQGDVIGIVAKNSTMAAPLVLGCFLAGTPVSTADPTYGSKEIAHIFDLTSPKIVFCDSDNQKAVSQALEKCENRCEVLTIDEKMSGYRCLTDLIKESRDADDVEFM